MSTFQEASIHLPLHLWVSRNLHVNLWRPFNLEGPPLLHTVPIIWGVGLQCQGAYVPLNPYKMLKDFLEGLWID